MSDNSISYCINYTLYQIMDKCHKTVGLSQIFNFRRHIPVPVLFAGLRLKKTSNVLFQINLNLNSSLVLKFSQASRRSPLSQPYSFTLYISYVLKLTNNNMFVLRYFSKRKKLNF